MKPQALIEIENLSTRLGTKQIHHNLNLTVESQHILGIIGASGCGKTTLLRCIIGLLQPSAGTIKIFGSKVNDLNLNEYQELQRRWGVMFQRSALFSSLTVLQNVMFPLLQFTDLRRSVLTELAHLKIALVGLPEEAAYQYPAELSGGMQKRAACARAIALDPEILFLDEPSTGLDPKSAESLDDLVLHLRNTLGLTIVLISHDLDTLWRVTDTVAFLGEGKVLANAPMPELVRNPHPAIQNYFSGPRGRQHR